MTQLNASYLEVTVDVDAKLLRSVHIGRCAAARKIKAASTFLIGDREIAEMTNTKEEFRSRILFSFEIRLAR